MPSRKVTSRGLPEPASGGRNPSIWVWLSIAAVVLAVVGNVIALSVPAIYAGLTPEFRSEALAQDVASLAITAPAWLILAILTLRGSLRARLLWLGVLTFTVYNYAIYTFSVNFGPLYFLWIVVLGLALYSVIGVTASSDHKGVKTAFTNQRPVKVAAWAFMITALLFLLLWLSEDVPAWLSGTAPQSVRNMALPTNPVHILDLAFFLPTVATTGVMLLRQRPLAYTLAPALLVFLILTGVPILITPLVQTAHGQSPAWGPVVPIGTLTVLLLALLIWLMSALRQPGSSK